jgi:hypothetical protein
MQEIKTVSFPGEILLNRKKQGLSFETEGNLRAEAERLLGEPTYTVIHRKMRAPNGNIHDYASIGTYWWKNPDTPDGLPYIRRDGETTPLAKEPITHEAMCKSVMTLALAAFFFDDARYAAASEKQIYDWYLNPETYMTPHAAYSQCIPGICDGRGIGIIDFHYSYHVFDAVAILEYMGLISEENVLGLKSWYVKFTDWLLTHEYGNDEDCEPNNHGTHFDALVLSAAIFTDRKSLIKKICTTAYHRRFISQVEPNGAQPLELARTMAATYSFLNITGLSLIAAMAKASGYDEFVSPDKARGNVILKSAINYIYPYAINLEAFPYMEMNPAVMQNHATSALRAAHRLFPEEGYLEMAKSFSPNPCEEWLTIV